MYKNPTDLKLLKCIYHHYRPEFELFDKDSSIRRCKIYVPIDCNVIAKQLAADPELVFGRLYYHLANVHKYPKAEGGHVKLFEFEVAKQRHCIHFPVLVSALATLEAEHQRYRNTLIASATAVVVAIGSLAINAYDVFSFKL